MNLSDVLDKIEPHLTQEELTLVGGMEADIGELEAQITDLENDVDKLNDDITELQNDVESLKLFRDPSNWDGNKFIPVLHYQRVSDPWNL